MTLTLLCCCRRRRRRWFARTLRDERRVRALSRALWDLTEACTPLHKIARYGLCWYVCEFDGRRWRERPELFDAVGDAYEWCLDRCRARMTDDELWAAVAAMQ